MYQLSSDEIKYFSSKPDAPKQWKKAIFTLADGREAFMWSSHPDFGKLAPGVTVSGDLTRGEYKGKEQWEIKGAYSPSRATPRAGGFTAAVKAKQAGIEKSMDRKEESIKMSGAQRDAILLVTTFYPELANDPKKEEIIKVKINAWKNWLMDEYNDPGVPF